MIAIIYKRDNSVSCRGHVVERYGSDMQLQHFASLDEAISWCGDMLGNIMYEESASEDALEYLFIHDGFEKALQEDQYYDKDKEIWTFAGDIGCFLKPTDEQLVAVKKIAIDYVHEKTANAKRIEELAQKERQHASEAYQKRLHAENIAKAKLLITQYPEEFK